MYLTEGKLRNVVQNQFRYKVKAYLSVFTSLMVIQVIGILLSTGRSSSMGTSSNGFSLNVSYYTGDIIIIFTMIWGFISAIILTTKAYRNDDFTFVSNRLSSNMSNMFFLLLASIIGGMTAILSGILLKIVMFFLLEDGYLTGTVSSFQELLLGMVVTFLYIYLLASLGYFVGMLAQLSKWFNVLIPSLFIGYLFLGSNIDGEPTILLETVKFYAKETSLLLFFVKILITVSLLFFVSIILSNKMEVRG